VTEHAVFYAFAHVGAESRIKKATFTEGKTHLVAIPCGNAGERLHRFILSISGIVT